jgi:Zn-dependent protease
LRGTVHPYRLAWSIRIARLFGIDIKVHLIFIVFLAVLSIQEGIKYRSVEAGLWFLLLFSFLFLFVLLHELGHSIVAQRLGIRVIDITLWPLGGLARLGRIPEDPGVELRIAVAGPAVNFAVALLVVLGVWITTGGEGIASLGNTQIGVILSDIILFTVWVNGLMGLFNLVPAFPLDGGRILRALAASRLPYYKATALAVTIGKILAFTGLLVLALNGKLLSWLSLICLFVYWAGSHELRMARAREYMKAAERGYSRQNGTQWNAAAALWEALQRTRTPRAKGDPDIIEADVVSTDGEEDAAKAGPEERPAYHDLPEEDLKRHLGKFEEEFLRLMERHRKGKD